MSSSYRATKQTEAKQLGIIAASDLQFIPLLLQTVAGVLCEAHTCSLDSIQCTFVHTSLVRRDIVSNKKQTCFAGFTLDVIA